MAFAPRYKRRHTECTWRSQRPVGSSSTDTTPLLLARGAVPALEGGDSGSRTPPPSSTIHTAPIPAPRVASDFWAGDSSAAPSCTRQAPSAPRGCEQCRPRQLPPLPCLPSSQRLPWPAEQLRCACCAPRVFPDTFPDYTSARPSTTPQGYVTQRTTALWSHHARTLCLRS